MPTSDVSLRELLDEAIHGRVRLPEFQRQFVWKLSDIREFLASLFLEYPVGSFLTVRDRRDLFRTRPLLGMSAEADNMSDTVTYLLDGQQRLTSCYLVFSNAYRNAEINVSIRRRWFLDLNKIGLNDEFKQFTAEELIEAFEAEDGALVALKVDLRETSRPETRDESDPDFKRWCHENGFLPLSRVLYGEYHSSLIERIADAKLSEIAATYDITEGSPEYKELSDRKDQWFNFVIRLLTSVANRTIPVIRLEQGSALEKVARIFETVNKTGQTLSLMDLFVARATSDSDPSLRDVIESARQEAEQTWPQTLLSHRAPDWSVREVLEYAGRLFDAEYPKVVAALVQLAEGQQSLALSKQQILSTPRESINRYAREAATRLIRAIAFLQIRCGVAWQIISCPYQAMILPIACVLNDDVWGSSEALDRLEAWYWAAIFSGRYIEGQDRKARQDVYSLRAYVETGGPRPDYVTGLYNLFVSVGDLKQASSSSDGLYRATLQFVLSRSPLDLRPNGPVLRAEFPYTLNGSRQRRYEDHHIIPRGWLDNNKRELESYEFRDSCLNRVYVSFEANRGANSGADSQNPRQYLAGIADEILESQLIPMSVRDETSSDPLGSLLNERYRLIRDAVIQRVASLS